MTMDFPPTVDSVQLSRSVPDVIFSFDTRLPQFIEAAFANWFMLLITTFPASDAAPVALTRLDELTRSSESKKVEL